MDEKYVWAALSAVGGWIVAQLTIFFQSTVRRNWLKKQINDEVFQLHEELQRYWMHYARALQMHAAGGIEPVVPLPLGMFIFREHYKDAALGFTRVQRIAVQMIYAYIEHLNETGNDLKTYAVGLQTRRLQEGGISDEEFASYARRLKAVLHSIGTTLWHVGHYLRHPDFPELPAEGEIYDEYIAQLAKVAKEVEKIEKSGKGLPLEGFFSHTHPADQT